jgi:hypothetical protein
MENNDKQILIIGKPATSKTTFLVQLYSLMRSGNGALKLEGLPESIKPIEDDYKRLRRGETTQPTPADNNIDLVLKLSRGDDAFTLICPDYGGEQINSLISNRVIKEQWVKLLANGNHWLLFLKLHDLTAMHDVTTKPATEGESQNEENVKSTTDYELSEAPETVELLQMLLFFKACGIQNPITQIDLKVVISRWDELNTDISIPADLLQQKLSLLYEFVFSNWEEQKVSVWGLSAQGFDLTPAENKEKYLEEGNEKWAFLIRPDGKKSHDITELLGSVI